MGPSPESHRSRDILVRLVAPTHRRGLHVHANYPTSLSAYSRGLCCPYIASPRGHPPGRVPGHALEQSPTASSPAEVGSAEPSVTALNVPVKYNALAFAVTSSDGPAGSATEWTMVYRRDEL